MAGPVRIGTCSWADEALSKHWYPEGTPAKERLAYIKARLGLAGELPPGTRYQLLHRAASAVIEAERFHAGDAVLVVHSFSRERASFNDYRDFLKLFGKKGDPGQLVALGVPNGTRRVASAHLSTTLASAAARTGSVSPAGDALATLPPIVPRF